VDALTAAGWDKQRRDAGPPQQNDDGRMTNDEGVSDCRLIVDPPLSGAWNMAVDEVLLDDASTTGRPTWRFYQWSEPTLSLGYFQPEADRRAHAASADCPVVRRLTGGGAILHDRELTYSVIVPADHRLATHRDRLYEAVHGSLIELLADRQLAADLARPERPTPPAEEPFLCFQRRAQGDVVLEGVKIAGSAQRRRRGAVLQHGSVLLDTSRAAPEIAPPGSIEAASLSPDRLAELWLPTLARRLGFRFQREPPSAGERRKADQLVATRYGTAQWTSARRSGR